MAAVKGTSIVHLRKIFIEKGTFAEEQFRSRLSPELQHLYETVLYSTLSPVEAQTELYRQAADVLFPNEDDRLCLLGKAIARKSYTGVYQHFLKIPTIQFVVNQAAKVWTMHYDTGTATVENFDSRNKRGEFVVRGFPGLPCEMLQTVRGHLMVLLEMAGARNIAMTIDDHDHDAWRWSITYQ